MFIEIRQIIYSATYKFVGDQNGGENDACLESLQK